MEYNFNKGTRILYFKLDPRIEYKNLHYLLWPAYDYTVLAPGVGGTKVNILQKAVLGLCRAGIVEADKIGTHLHIHEDLSAAIILQLQERHWLGKDWQPTKEGLEILDSETEELGNPVVGHVFQDPWTGELWPRFIENPNVQETEFNKSGYPDLIIGSKGKHHSQEARMVIPKVGETTRLVPEAKEILHANKKHRWALRYWNGPGTTFENEEDGDIDLGINPYDLKRISYVDKTPRPVFLSTFAFVPKDAERGVDWNVCDPFGLGTSPMLRKAIERRFGENPGLMKYLGKLVKPSSEAAGNLDELFQRLRKEAEFRVEEALTLGIRSSALYEDLVNMESSLLEAEQASGTQQSLKLQAVLINTQKTLEGIFELLNNKYPCKQAWKSLYANQGNDYWKPIEDRFYSRKLYLQLAEQLGFETSTLPDSLLIVKPGKVRSAAEWNSGSLRPLILSTLLASARYEEHPLRRAAQSDPFLLKRLATLADLRDPSSHYQEQGKKKEPIKFELVKEQVQLSYQVATIFQDIVLGY